MLSFKSFFIFNNIEISKFYEVYATFVWTVIGHTSRKFCFKKNHKSIRGHILEIVFSEKSQVHRMIPDDFEHYKVKCTQYMLYPESQIALHFALWMDISKIFLLFHFPIGLNVNFQCIFLDF